MSPSSSQEEWSSQAAKDWAEEHLKFLKEHNPRLFQSLSQSGSLEEHLRGIGESAEERESHLLAQALHATNHLPYMERVRELQSHQRSAQEIIRHDLIHSPLPE